VPSELRTDNYHESVDVPGTVGDINNTHSIISIQQPSKYHNVLIQDINCDKDLIPNPSHDKQVWMYIQNLLPRIYCAKLIYSHLIIPSNM